MGYTAYIFEWLGMQVAILACSCGLLHQHVFTKLPNEDRNEEIGDNQFTFDALSLLPSAPLIVNLNTADVKT